MNGWWYVAGAMFVISTVLWRLMIARRTAANPSARLPWFGRPPNRPRGLKLLQFFAVGSMVAGMYFVVDGFGRLQDIPYHDVFSGVPFALIVGVVGVWIPYARHNRRVRRAALQSPRSQQPGY